MHKCPLTKSQQVRILKQESHTQLGRFLKIKSNQLSNVVYQYHIVVPLLSQLNMPQTDIVWLTALQVYKSSKQETQPYFFSNFVCSFLIQSESGSVFMSTNLRQTFSSRKISLNEACLTQWGSRRLKSIWVLLSKSSHEREREGEGPIGNNNGVNSQVTSLNDKEKLALVKNTMSVLQKFFYLAWSQNVSFTVSVSEKFEGNLST